MKRIDLWLLGYRRVSISHRDKAAVASRLLTKGLWAEFASDGTFAVPLYRYKKTVSELQEVPYTASSVIGLPAVLYGLLRWRSIWLGGVLSFFLMLFFSLFVWDVRINAEEGMDTEAAYQELSALGLSVGAPWKGLELAELQTALLENSQSVGWVNIHRRGNVAYVQLKGKHTPPSKPEEAPYVNVVAKEDCVIEQITVKQGVAAVKVGDSVKAGDLLIGGVLPAGQSAYLHGEGSVLGRMTREVRVFVPRRQVKPVLGEEILTSVTLKIFRFNINIYKNSRNFPDEYDIINENVLLSPKDGVRMPFGIERSIAVQRTTTVEEHGEAELVFLAKEEMDARIHTMLAEGELLGLSTEGQMTDEGYILRCRVEYLCEVGTERPFEVQK